MKRSIKQNTKQNTKRYAICMAGLVILVLGAFLGPQFVFAGQDRYHMENTWQETRNSLDIEKLSYNYEQSMMTRMENFARGIAEKRTYYTSFMDCEANQEIGEIVAQALFHDWLYILEETGAVPFSVQPNRIASVEEDGSITIIDNGIGRIEECKKYVICEDNFENGAAIIAWYVKINVREGVDLKLLIDAESNSIYYMEAVNRKGKIFESYATLPDALTYYLPGLDDRYSYYREYYEAQAMERDNRYGFDNQSMEKFEMAEQAFAWKLLYGDYPLHFEVNGQGDIKSNVRITAGIREIGEMIPEMMQE